LYSLLFEIRVAEKNEEKKVLGLLNESVDVENDKGLIKP
jgi:hypothetical protein